MKSFLAFVGVLALGVLFLWVFGKAPALVPFVQTGVRLSPTPAKVLSITQPCAGACSQTALAVTLTQAKINLSALQAQATATADILRANVLATSNALASTQGVALTEARDYTNALAATQSVLQAQVAATADALRANVVATAVMATTRSVQQTETSLQQFHLQRTSDAATQNASTALAQQRLAQFVSDTATANPAFQTQARLVQKPEWGALLWMGLTPVMIIVVVVSALWGLARWRGGGQSAVSPMIATPMPVVIDNLPLAMKHNLPQIIPPLPTSSEALPKVAPSQTHLANPDSRQVRGWLEEVKLKLLIQKKVDDDHSNR